MPPYRIHSPSTIAPALEPASTVRPATAVLIASSSLEPRSTSSRCAGSPPVRYITSAQATRETRPSSSASLESRTMSESASAPSPSKYETPFAAAFEGFCLAAAVGTMSTFGRVAPAAASISRSIGSQPALNSSPPTRAMGAIASWWLAAGSADPANRECVDRRLRADGRPARLQRSTGQPGRRACPARDLRARQLHRLRESR